MKKWTSWYWEKSEAKISDAERVEKVGCDVGTYQLHWEVLSVTARAEFPFFISQSPEAVGQWPLTSWGPGPFQARIIDRTLSKQRRERLSRHSSTWELWWKRQPTEFSSLILSISTRTDSATEERVSGNEKPNSLQPDLDEGRVKLPSGSFHLDRAWTEKITQGKKPKNCLPCTLNSLNTGNSISKNILVIGLHPHFLSHLFLTITAGLNLSISQENILKQRKHFTILEPFGGQLRTSWVILSFRLSPNWLRASPPASSSLSC